MTYIFCYSILHVVTMAMIARLSRHQLSTYHVMLPHYNITCTSISPPPVPLPFYTEGPANDELRLQVTEGPAWVAAV